MSEWVTLFAVPSANYGDANLALLAFIADALGYRLTETDVDYFMGPKQVQWVSVSVPERYALPLKMVTPAEEPAAEAEPVAPAEPEPEPEPPKAPPTDAPQDALPDHHPDSLYQRTCQKCGKEFKTRNGRLIHNGRAHGDNPDYVAIAAEIDAQREATVTPIERGAKKTTVLRCGEPACHFTADYATDLNTHTMGTHRRRATTEERTPVPRDDVAEAGQ